MAQTRLRVAYVIRTGDYDDNRSISHNLRSRNGVKSALAAARRMGWPNAFAAKTMIRLLPGEKLRGE